MPARIRTAMRRSTPLSPLLGLDALTLSTCSVGPDYQPLQPSTPAAFNDLLRTRPGRLPGAGRPARPQVVAYL